MKNFQSLASEQGRWSHQTAEQRLQEVGFDVAGTRVQLPSVEIDVIADNKNNISFYWTVKGSWRGDRPGCLRTDTLKKAIAECYFIRQETGCAGIIITTHFPKSGRGAQMLTKVNRDIVYDVIHLMNDTKRLKWLLKATENDLSRDQIANSNLLSMLRKRVNEEWEDLED